MIYTTGSGKIELQITKKQAQKGYHSGQCDQDIAELRQIPAIKRQLAKIDEAVLVDELKHWGAWDEEELQNHEENLDRFLWLACADIVETYCLGNKMQTIKTKDITATRPTGDVWFISATIGGHLIVRCYPGFTKKEAIIEFKREVTKCKQ